jgi:putative nucleotidyltransferase with HDIG domain
VHPDDLRIGLYVHLDLGWMEHPFTFSNFKIKDEEQISKIRELNLKKIRYDPMRSDVVLDFPATIQTTSGNPGSPPPTTPAPEIQQSNRLKQLNDLILESEHQFAKNSFTAHEAVRNLSTRPEYSRQVAETLVKDMVGSVITESDVVLHAINHNNRSLVSFIHPLNVTVLALMMAKSLDMSEEEAMELGTAAMFHDVGKEESLQRQSFMDDMHCELGAHITKRAGLSDRVSNLVLQHHEYMDGSGYPKQLRNDEIDPLARILVLVNHYDNLCNTQSPAQAMTPYEALSQMYTTESQKFDSTLLKHLVKSLGVYPPGSVVELSNGNYGIVMSINPDKPLRPLVMLYVPEVARETPVVIDLGQEKEIMLKKCLRPTQLPREVYNYLRPSKRVSYYFIKRDEHALPPNDWDAYDNHPARHA